MPSDRPIDAITFDFWNTLIRADDAGVRDRRLAAWLGLLAGEGFDFDRDVLHVALRHGTQRFTENWKANRIYRADDAVTDMLEHLGVAPSPDVREQLLRSITDPDEQHDPHPTPNIEAALRSLRDAGVKIGIICDVGLAPSTTLRRYLDRHGLLGYFDHWSFSDEVGVFKPDPAIFDHALEGLGGIDPSRAAHIGDLRRTDVAGAKDKGILAIRYTGVSDDPGDGTDGSDQFEGDLLIGDHQDLPSALGL